MTKIKHVSLFLLLFFCMAGIQAQNEAVIKRTHDRLISYFEHNMFERTCLITDKDVYKPGESILFSALAGSLTAQGLYPVSSSVKISLNDAGGKVLIEESFDFSAGRASGNLRVPPDLTAGKYALVAHSPAVRNEDEACMKLIFIDPMTEGEIIIDGQKIPEMIIAGESHPMMLALHDLAGEAVSGQKLNYELLSEDQLLASGKLKTDEQGILNFELSVPEGEYNGPLLLKISDSKEVNYKHWFHVNTEKLKVNFYPEGVISLPGSP
jgi:MG2 domain.